MTSYPTPASAFFARYESIQEADSSNYPPLPNELPVPRLANPTTTVLPSYNYVKNTIGLPIAIEFTPFEYELIEKSTLPPRCKRCGAYLQTPFQLQGNSFTCLLCGRLNEDLTGLVETPKNPAEFEVSEAKYAPATVDARGVSEELLQPAEISHVESEVFSESEVLKAASAAYKEIRNMTGARDGEIPTTERLEDRTVNLDELEERYKFVHIFIVEISFNSIYQGILTEILKSIHKFLLTSDPNVEVGVIFSAENMQVFSHLNNKIELFECACDPLSGEPTIPIPLEEFCYNCEDVERFKEFSKLALEYYYNVAEKFPEMIRLGLNTSGEALAGVISSLERIGGIVTFVLTDRVSEGLGLIKPEEQKVYELTDKANAASTQEGEYYNRNLYYNRLAREAAAHNISVNVIALPFNHESLGLMELSPLTYLTGGNLYYNEPALLVTEAEETGNSLFAADAMVKIFETEAIQCTFTLRCSKGIEMSLYEEVEAEEISNVISSSKKIIKSIVSEKAAKQEGLKTIDYTTKDEVYGSFEKISDLELNFCSLKRSSAFHVALRLSEELENPAFEFALLYTNQQGERVSRVFTIKIEASDVAARVYNGADEYEIAAFEMKKLANQFLEAKAIENKAEQAFNGYCNSKSALMKEENEKSGNLSKAEIESIETQTENAIKQDIEQQVYLLFEDGNECLKREFTLFEDELEDFKEILKGFQSIAGSNNNNQNRILIPQTLEILPIFFYGMQKSQIIARKRQQAEGGLITADQRVAQACFWLQESSLKVCNSLCCGVYDVLEIIREFEVCPGQIYCPLPPASVAIKNAFEGVYLFASSEFCYLLVGRSVPKEILNQLFEDTSDVSRCIDQFASEQVNIIVQNVKNVFEYFGGVYICQENSAFEGARRWMMMLDGFSQSVGYQEYLQNLSSLIK